MPDAPNIAHLPETLREIVAKLYNYGFTLEQDNLGIWSLNFPEGDPSGYTRVGFRDEDLAAGLLRALRKEEELRGDLYRYEQFDARWGKQVYGNRPGDTTIAAAGCGPTSLAIVLQYLMNGGPRPRNATYAITPPQTAKYAATHGRVSGSGTNGNKMIAGIKEQWPGFEGQAVSLNEATGLLQEGKLIIFLSHGCHGYSRNRPLHRQPDVVYTGHFMVLAGVEGLSGPDQLFYVVDPGRNTDRAMRFIRRPELAAHAAGYWWVHADGDASLRVSGN